MTSFCCREAELPHNITSSNDGADSIASRRRQAIEQTAFGVYPSASTPPKGPADLESQPTLASSFLAVGDGHELYIEEEGRGRPIVFLHGGPGSGFRAQHRKLFDANRYRSVFFDQRGAGRSRPKGSLSANTTDHLIADIEAIRIALGIDRWLVVGGSWGATLALAYAERHPDRVAGLVLRAVFLGTRAELNWAFLDGPRQLRPELLAGFLSALPESERADPLPAIWKRILDPDPAIHRPAIWAWHDTERVLSEIAPAARRIEIGHAAAGQLPSTPVFEAHYFSNGCFLAPGQLLAEANRLADIPGAIIQGRYDLLCPPGTSATLAEMWPRSSVRIVEGAGHAMSEPGITEAMTEAISDISAAARF